ncbi:MAG: hypothetical protein HYV95_16040 [Opitutae bacterium]|nr:hypothetical protein [Opitutae bacterium]
MIQLNELSEQEMTGVCGGGDPPPDDGSGTGLPPPPSFEVYAAPGIDPLLGIEIDK